MSTERPVYSPSSSLGAHSGSGRHGDGVVRSQAVWLPWERRVWMVLLYLGAVSLYLTRMTLPVAIVELAVREEWNKQTCGVILSSFFWGYILLQVVGGALADRYGGDRVHWVSGVVWSLGTLLTVAAIPFSSSAVIAVRFIMGLTQGVYYPAASSLVSHRAPEELKNYYFSVMTAGSSSGNVLAACLGAFLLFNGKWPCIFIASGLIALAWTFAVCYFSFLSQPVHRTHYKLNDSGGSAPRRQRLRLEVPQTASVMASCAGVPWRKLLRQPPVIVLLLGHTASTFFSHNLMFWLPTFFNETFPSRIELSWLYNGLPWVSMAMGALVAGWLATKLLSRDVSLTRVRKILATLCLGGGGTFLLLLPALLPSPSSPSSSSSSSPDHFPSTLLFMALSFFCNGCGTACFLVNSSDLSPSFVGSLSGVMNTFGTLPGVFGVTLTGFILHRTGSWALVFSIITAANLLALLFYLAFGSGKRLQLDPS